MQQNIKKIEVKANGALREIIYIQPSVKNGTDSGPILRTEGVVARRSNMSMSTLRHARAGYPSRLS